MTASNVYASGSSSIADFRGVAAAMSPVGVVALSLSENVKSEMTGYNAKGGKIFVDSGAFGAFKEGRTLDFDKVLAEYHDLAGRMANPAQLALVAPDQIGDMDSTARLQRDYIISLRTLARTGIDLMIPLQRGWEIGRYQQHCEWLRSILGEFTVAFASKEEAWPLMEMLAVAKAINPQRIHLLGAGMEKYEKFSGVLMFHLDNVTVTGDANRLRSKIGRKRELTDLISAELSAIAEGQRSQMEDHYDETEEFWDVFNTPGHLSKSQVRGLAMSLGVTDEEMVARMVQASTKSAPDGEYGCKLGDLLDRIDCGQVRFFFVAMGMIELHLDAVMKETSPAVRSRCIAKVIGADMAARERRMGLKSSQMMLDLKQAA